MYVVYAQAQSIMKILMRIQDFFFFSREKKSLTFWLLWFKQAAFEWNTIKTKLGQKKETDVGCLCFP